MVKTDRVSLITGNTVVAMLFMVTTEIMFFTGLISAYIVNRETSKIPWPPPELPKLPMFITGINTVILTLSAVLLVVALIKIKKSRTLALPLLWATVALGFVFVAIQGIEWVKMLSYGFTIKSAGLFASFYYTLIGAHAFHAIAGILAGSIIVLQYTFMKEESFVYNRIGAMSFYWFFVVGIWPFIYYVIYLY